MATWWMTVLKVLLSIVTGEELTIVTYGSGLSSYYYYKNMEHQCRGFRSQDIGASLLSGAWLLLIACVETDSAFHILRTGDRSVINQRV